jgi:hypothetical protein
MAYGNYAPFYRGGFFNPMQTPTMPPMADNQNQFAQPYQPPIQQAPQPITPPTSPTQTPQMSNDMIWVQGLAGAKAYLVAPNTTVTLWDSESETIYLKSCDSNGMPSMKILDIKERVENAPKSPSNEVDNSTKDFALADDLKVIHEELTHKYEELEELFEKLSEKVDKLAVKPTPKTTKKTESE